MMLCCSQADMVSSERDEHDTSPRWAAPPLIRKPSVAKMTFSGMAYIVAVSMVITIVVYVCAYWLVVQFCNRSTTYLYVLSHKTQEMC